MPVEITALSDEMAIGFTLEYNAATLSNPRVGLGEAAPDGAILTVNYDETGRIGILVDSSGPMAASATHRQIITLTFDVASGAEGDSAIVFSNSLASKGTSDAAGNLRPTRWRGGVIRVLRPE